MLGKAHRLSDVKFYNDKRKFCPGCRQNRSAAQFAATDSRYCQRCLRRGVEPAEAAPANERAYPTIQTK